MLPLCISRVLGALNREEHIKKLNMEVLMQTRSEDAKVRLLALKSAIQSWAEEGVALSGTLACSPWLFMANTRHFYCRIRNRHDYFHPRMQ